MYIHTYILSNEFVVVRADKLCSEREPRVVYVMPAMPSYVHMYNIRRKMKRFSAIHEFKEKI